MITELPHLEPHHVMPRVGPGGVCFAQRLHRMDPTRQRIARAQPGSGRNLGVFNGGKVAETRAGVGVLGFEPCEIAVLLGGE